MTEQPKPRDMTEVFRRMEEEWERHPGATLSAALDCAGEGWHPLVRRGWELVTAHGGRVKQVKEKLGTLRIYYDRVPNSVYNQVQDEIREIEAASGTICEWCGAPGELRDRECQEELAEPASLAQSWWLKTLCSEHAFRWYHGRERWWSQDGPRVKALSNDPEVLHGRTVFTGNRVPIDIVLDYKRGGLPIEEFFEGYPSVERWKSSTCGLCQKLN